MEQINLLFYLKTLHNALNIPIVYCELGKKNHSFTPFSVNASENELDFVAQRMQNVLKRQSDCHISYLLHPHLILLGLIQNPEEGSFILIGPLATPDTREEDIADYLFFAGISSETTRQLSAYLNSSKIWSVDTLKQLVLNVNMVFNDEMLTDSNFVLIEDHETELKFRFRQKHFAGEADNQMRVDSADKQDFTDKLNYCLIHGDVITMAEMMTQMGNVTFTSSTPITAARLKQIAYGSVFAAENTALKSGIPPASLSLTKQYYLDRIDRAAAIDEYRRLSVGAIFDFTKCVKEYLSEKTDSPTIRQAIEYIKENLNSKLLADDIADAIHISTHCLFTKFKKETGQTLTEFINKEKIQKACYYMVFTDNSFSEIANFLSFSSQSYFQSVFKKVMGQTPNEWRKTNRNISA